MTTPPNSPFAIDWYDGIDWQNEVYCPTLEEALVVAAQEMRQAIKQYPDDFHILRIHGPNTYITLDSNPDNGW